MISEQLDVIVKEISRQQEEYLLEQLQEHVSRGLIVVEKTKPRMYIEASTNKYKIEESIRFKLKEQEYIEKLEEKNRELKLKLQMINTALVGVENGESEE